MLKNRSGRTGFTLPEVLVTVAIVAVLAAVVVPTVTKQIGKGDDTNLATNVAALRTAITAFVSDVRKVPARLQHLATQPATGDSSLTGTYSGTQTRWKGPYQQLTLKAATTGAAADSVPYGSLGFIIDVIKDTAFGAPNSGFVGITIGGVPNTAAALHIDSLIDGATGQTAGNLQWAGTAPAVTGNRLTLLLMGR